MQVGDPAQPRGIEAVTRWLDARGVAYEVVEHAETFRAVDEAQAAGVSPRITAKTILLHDQGVYRLVVIPASRQLDLARLRDRLGASAHLRLATENEMLRDFPAFEVGALPPFGPMIPATEIVDTRLLYRERLLCSGGDHRHAIALDPRDLVRLTEPQVADICTREGAAHRKDFAELPRI
jgi:Ala-tRNA(Pro) deacylase